MKRAILFGITAITMMVVITLFSYADESVDELIATLTKNPSRLARAKAAGLLGEIAGTGNASVDKALVQAILTDSSWEVRVASLRARARIKGRIARELYQEQDRGIRSGAATEEKLSKLRGQYAAPLKELFKSSYSYNCDCPNEVKAAAVGSFILLEGSEGLELLLEVLKENCALSFEERKKRESLRPGRGDALTLDLQHVIATYGKRAIPPVEQELGLAKGDHRYSLLIILSKVSDKLEYSRDAGKRISVHEFDRGLLPQCEEGLLTTESPGIRRELARILKTHGYIPASADAQKIIDQFTAKKDTNTKY